MKKQVLATIRGAVVRYGGKGRQLGYPTANLAADTDLADGVYFGTANLADYTDQPALIFIGTPTTVGDKHRRIEAHVLDIADKDYYGLDLELNIMHFHRSNQTFGSVEELMTAMKDDEIIGRQWFKTHTFRTSQPAA